MKLWKIAVRIYEGGQFTGGAVEVEKSYYTNTLDDLLKYSLDDIIYIIALTAEDGELMKLDEIKSIRDDLYLYNQIQDKKDSIAKLNKKIEKIQKSLDALIEQ